MPSATNKAIIAPVEWLVAQMKINKNLIKTNQNGTSKCSARPTKSKA